MTTMMEKKRVLTVKEILFHVPEGDTRGSCHIHNTVTKQFWCDEDGVCFIDHQGILWIDHPELDEAFCEEVSDENDFPTTKKPLMHHESTDLWIGLTDPRGEWYRLIPSNLDVTMGETDQVEKMARFVLVESSLQHTPYERVLSLVGRIPKWYREGDWIVGLPTPYGPKAILR